MKAAKIRHKKIIIKNIVIVLAVIFTFTFFIIAAPSFFEVIAIAIITLTMAYWLDKYISGERKDKNIGGRNP